MLEPPGRLLTSGRTLHVTADDRSGAMEAAALCADAGWDAVVCSWDGEPATSEADVDGVVVTDLRSRHVSGDAAVLRMRAAVRRTGPVRVHKIDSTLRGNWAAELGELAQQGPVVLIPAYPQAGRTCEDGVVLVDGVPVHRAGFGADLRSATTSSRPAEVLDAVQASDADGLRGWLGSTSSGICVCDARTDADISALVIAALAADGVVLAGPASIVGAVARVLASSPGSSAPTIPSGDAVVVCGSRHPRSVAQTDAVEGRHDVAVIRPPAHLRADAEIVALELAGRAHDAVAERGASLVVLLGGDTAEAFIGQRVVRVWGSVGVGMALGTLSLGSSDITIVTKPGGFGDDRAVSDLLDRRGAR